MHPFWMHFEYLKGNTPIIPNYYSIHVLFSSQQVRDEICPSLATSESLGTQSPANRNGNSQSYKTFRLQK